MDKLEQILHAEERARKTVASARERARSIVNQAKAEHELLVSETRTEAEREADRLRESTLRDCDEQSRRIEEKAAAEMREHIRSAESRLSDAVEAVVEELGT